MHSEPSINVSKLQVNAELFELTLLGVALSYAKLLLKKVGGISLLLGTVSAHQDCFPRAIAKKEIAEQRDVS